MLENASFTELFADLVFAAILLITLIYTLSVISLCTLTRMWPPKRWVKGGVRWVLLSCAFALLAVPLHLNISVTATYAYASAGLAVGVLVSILTRLSKEEREENRQALVLLKNARKRILQQKRDERA